MNEASSTFDRATSPATPSAISSPALEDGASQLGSPGGPTTVPCGPARVRASRSVSPAPAADPPTSGTYGPTCFASSVPAGPLSSWESRLRQRLARIGSTECLLTWKASVTPAGRSLSRLVPSTRPTGEIASGLWPTPQTADAKTGSIGWEAASERHAANGVHKQMGLRDLVPRTAAALWPTPAVSDATGGKMPPEGTTLQGARPDGGKAQVGLSYAAKSLWPTPTAQDHSRGQGTIRPHDTGIPLPQRVAQALWPTLTSRDRKDGSSVGTVPVNGLLGRQVWGSEAPTEKPGALNPAFVCWLMGFPPEWESCAPTAMPSSRKSRRKSSAPTLAEILADLL
jgi:hypothetical protein